MYTEEQLSRMNLGDLKHELATKKEYFNEEKKNKSMSIDIFSGQIEGEIKQLETEISIRKIDDILDISL